MSDGTSMASPDRRPIVARSSPDRRPIAALSPPWQLPAARTTLAGMDTAPRPGDRADTLSPETEAERQRRLAWEAEMIAEADADIAAGRLIDEAEIDAWIDSIGTDHELPPPRSGR
jgi:hypothetical protein